MMLDLQQKVAKKNYPKHVKMKVKYNIYLLALNIALLHLNALYYACDLSNLAKDIHDHQIANISNKDLVCLFLIDIEASQNLQICLVFQKLHLH